MLRDYNDSQCGSQSPDPTAVSQPSGIPTKSNLAKELKDASNPRGSPSMADGWTHNASVKQLVDSLHEKLDLENTGSLQDVCSAIT